MSGVKGGGSGGGGGGCGGGGGGGGQQPIQCKDSDVNPCSQPCIDPIPGNKGNDGSGSCVQTQGSGGYGVSGGYGGQGGQIQGGGGTKK
ncbi:loricrin-like [Pelobates fuscus]|uniref:loricrin-like n=1 Tax=Pelobates fuscus TaxID=191477 RepID=UPI002FE49D5F